MVHTAATPLSSQQAVEKRAVLRFPRVNVSRKTIATAVMALIVFVATAGKAQDKYSLKSPGGIAFSDFKGYEDWAVVSSARTDEVLKVIVANPAMISAYKAGVPGNGKPFPDGARMAKIHWLASCRPRMPTRHWLRPSASFCSTR